MIDNSAKTNTTLDEPPLISGNYLSMDWLTEPPPPPEFCVTHLVPIGGVTLLNAHGGTGKSLFALKMAVHIALGIPIIGAKTNGGKVAYMSLEDPETIVRERLFKIVNKLHPDAKKRHQELTTKLMIIDRYGQQTHMAINEGGNIKTTPIADELGGLLKKHQIKCLFVDTFIRTNTLNENDNAQMGALLVAFEGIAKEAECGVVLIHHLPKGSDNKSYAARGASAITDNARSALLMEIVSKNDKDKFAEEDIKIAVAEERLLRITHTKRNYSQKNPERYLEMSPNGVLLEVFPTLDSKSDFRLRYRELYRWWAKAWERKPLTKTNIEQNVEKIRPAKYNYGKEKYKTALDWSIEHGLVKEVPAPEGGSKNTKATYYTLLPDVSD